MMSMTKETASPTAPAKQTSNRKHISLIISFLVLIGILCLPTPADLSTAGHRMIAILFFAIVMWITSAVSYPVSATLLTALTAVLLGTAPNIDAPAKLLGTGAALRIAISGYSTPAWALVAAAMFISVAMTKTGLDRRIALNVLSRIGTKTSHIYMGVLFTGFILAFFVPSATARLACLVPIILGILDSLEIDRQSKLAALLVVGATQGDTLWNIMVQTAAAQNLVAVGFISQQLNTTVSWLDWIIAAGPYSLVMIVIYYFLSMKILKPDQLDLKGSQEQLQKHLTELGPMSFNEKKLLAYSVILLGFWATGNYLHKYDTSTTTIVAIAIFLLPGIGIIDWKYAQSRIDWGSIVMFGAGISLGTALLKTKAATWLANAFIHMFTLETLSVFALIGAITLFLIAIHLGFASATALASAMIPIVISIVTAVNIPGVNPVGLTMIAQFSICFGFILPVNSPQGMVAYSTGTFEVKTFMKTGIPITVIGYLMLLVYAATYWQWLGLV